MGQDSPQWCSMIGQLAMAQTGIQEVPLNVRKNLDALRMTEHWNRLPREAVGSPSPERFQTHFHMILSR